ncbi:MAG: Chromosome partition protein Smc [Mycoplasmataceae bacterium]|nr:MAG: Chromosome partition protein Smc [Mycoplasmataceae bacterium]
MLSTQAKQDLVNELNKKLQQGKKDLLALGMTEELMSNTEAIIESVKDLKEELESELTLSKGKIKELEKELAKLKEESQGKAKILERKKEELEELKKTVISNNDLEDDDLEDLLENQIEFIKDPSSKRLERIKKRMLKVITESEITHLCQLQSEITQLEIDLGKARIINYFSGNFTNFTGGIGGSVLNSQNVNVDPLAEIEEQQAQIIQLN